jgi:hypothetical protein
MNPYEALAERQISAPRKARQRAIEKRARTRAGEALAERDQQFALWRKWRQERSEALFAGPYADAARDLLNLLDHLALEDGERLVVEVRAGPWAAADADTQFLILAAIDNALSGVRERAGQDLGEQIEGLVNISDVEGAIDHKLEAMDGG